MDTHSRLTQVPEKSSIVHMEYISRTPNWKRAGYGAQGADLSRWLAVGLEEQNVALCSGSVPMSYSVNTVKSAGEESWLALFGICLLFFLLFFVLF